MVRVPKLKLVTHCMTCIVRALDFVHSIMSCIGNWQYLIAHFGDTLGADSISWCVRAFTTENSADVPADRLGVLQSP